MSSSTSSSEDPARWARFLRVLLGFAALPLAFAYAFIALVDPWGVLPASLPIERVPISTNQRFSYAMLARDRRFDSAVIGTSTSRLLRPAVLDDAFGGRFVNLSINAGTAWEQMQLLGLFMRHHPDARRVLIGLDMVWCETGPLRRLTPRPFPEWMYEGSPWRGYGEVLNLYAAEEAVRQAGAALGLVRPRYGRDGYTNFLPDDSRYDAARILPTLVAGPSPPAQDPPPAFGFAAHPLLERALAALPRGTEALLFFVPYHRSLQGQPGTLGEQQWHACKDAIAAIVRRRPGAVLADFMIPSPITLEATNYWDQQHYRVAIAERIERDLAAAAAGRGGEDVVLLVPPVGH